MVIYKDEASDTEVPGWFRNAVTAAADNSTDAVIVKTPKASVFVWV